MRKVVVACSSARSSQNALPPEDGWRRDRPKRRNVSMQEVGVNRPNNALNDFTRPPPQSGFRSVLAERYGPAINTAFRNLEKAQQKLCREQNSLTFLMRCRDQKIIPNGLRLKTPSSSQRASRICKRASLALVREQIDHHRQQKRFTVMKINTLRQQLQSNLTAEEFERVESAVSRSNKEYNNQVKSRQIRKFNHLKHEAKAEKRPPMEGVVINKSSRQLTDAETSLLSKGLNYAVRPKRIPLMDIVASIEDAAASVPSTERDAMRYRCKEALLKRREPKPNLTRDEQKALQQLSKDEEIIILPADKGNATVVMNKSEYNNKMESLLSSGQYRKVKTHKTNGVERKIKALLKKAENEIPRDTLRILNPNNSKAPHMYGKPKIHKPDMPLRPIISNIGSPCHQLAKFLTGIISPLIGNTDSYVRNSKHFVTMIAPITIQPTEIMVSFDVESLFTSVPTAEVPPILRSKLEAESALSIQW